MSDAELIKMLRRALGTARPFVVAASEGKGRWVMAAGGAMQIIDYAMIMSDAATGDLPPPVEKAKGEP